MGSISAMVGILWPLCLGPTASAPSTAPVAPPELYFHDAAALAGERVRYAQAGPAERKGWADLHQRAAAAAKKGVYSVMDKTQTPPSGDRHDYLSLAIYWWPDPRKPDGRPYLRRDGEVNPECDSDATDKARLGRMLSAADTLARAWYVTGEAEYAAAAARVLRTWFLDPATRMNPNLEYAQVILGRPTKNPWGIIDGVGLVRAIDSVRLLEGAPDWSADDQAGLVRWFGAYLDWLLTSRSGIQEGLAPNNHGTWYDVQVTTSALFVGRRDLARRTVELSRNRIPVQILPDGRQPQELARTKSLHYSLYNLRAWFTLAELGDRLGVDLWRYETADGRGVRRALDFLAGYADPAVAWPYREIAGVDAARRTLAPFLRQAAEVYGEPRYADLAGKLGVPSTLPGR